MDLEVEWDNSGPRRVRGAVYKMMKVEEPGSLYERAPGNVIRLSPRERIVYVRMSPAATLSRLARAVTRSKVE